MTQKFTAQEWAAMEGGHSIDDIESAEKPFSFIQDIYESRMTRTGGVKTLTYTDCCERAYLTLLIIELLRYFPTFKSDLQEYARSTTRHSGYGHYRTHATDLYNFIHFITGNDEDLDKLKDPEAAKKVREVTHFPAMAVNRYLSQIANSQLPLDRAQVDGVTWGAVAYARDVSGEDYLDSVNEVHAFGRRMAHLMTDFDVLITATLGQPPARIGQLKPDNDNFWEYRNGKGGVFEYSPFTAAFNATGQPAVSLPLHWSANDLPIGVHFAMRFGEDEALMSLSAEIEQAAPWFDKQQEIIARINPS